MPAGRFNGRFNGTVRREGGESAPVAVLHRGEVAETGPTEQVDGAGATARDQAVAAWEGA